MTVKISYAPGKQGHATPAMDSGVVLEWRTPKVPGAPKGLGGRLDLTKHGDQQADISAVITLGPSVDPPVPVNDKAKKGPAQTLAFSFGERDVPMENDTTYFCVVTGGVPGFVLEAVLSAR